MTICVNTALPIKGGNKKILNLQLTAFFNNQKRRWSQTNMQTECPAKRAALCCNHRNTRLQEMVLSLASYPGVWDQIRSALQHSALTPSVSSLQEQQDSIHHPSLWLALQQTATRPISFSLPAVWSHRHGNRDTIYHVNVFIHWAWHLDQMQKDYFWKRASFFFLFFIVN